MISDLTNPFTPFGSVSEPSEFFGRENEIKQFITTIASTNIYIDGPVGIGKTSLLNHILDNYIKQPEPKYNVLSITCTSQMTDDVSIAHEVLQNAKQGTEKSVKWRFGVKGFFERESSTTVKSGPISLIDYFEKYQATNTKLLLLAIDEADKAVSPLSALTRYVMNETNKRKIRCVRLALCGVAPFFVDMLHLDPGLARMFGTPIDLNSFSHSDAEQLIDNKIDALQSSEANKPSKNKLRIDKQLKRNFLKISGLHPHLLQLIGYYTVESERENPDGNLNDADILNAIRNVCYGARKSMYDDLFNRIEINGIHDDFGKLMTLTNGKIPTMIKKPLVQETLTKENLEWLVKNNVLKVLKNYYSLKDEFVRFRFILDSNDQDEKQMVEDKLLALLDNKNSDDSNG